MAPAQVMALFRLALPRAFSCSRKITVRLAGVSSTLRPSAEPVELMSVNVTARSSTTRTVSSVRGAGPCCAKTPVECSRNGTRAKARRPGRRTEGKECMGGSRWNSAVGASGRCLRTTTPPSEGHVDGARCCWRTAGHSTHKRHCRLRHEWERHASRSSHAG